MLPVVKAAFVAVAVGVGLLMGARLFAAVLPFAG